MDTRKIVAGLFSIHPSMAELDEPVMTMIELEMELCSCSVYDISYHRIHLFWIFPLKLAIAAQIQSAKAQ